LAVTERTETAYQYGFKGADARGKGKSALR
jgi:hypothetical protein